MRQQAQIRRRCIKQTRWWKWNRNRKSLESPVRQCQERLWSGFTLPGAVCGVLVSERIKNVGAVFFTGPYSCLLLQCWSRSMFLLPSCKSKCERESESWIDSLHQCDSVSLETARTFLLFFLVVLFCHMSEFQPKSRFES